MGHYYSEMHNGPSPDEVKHLKYLRNEKERQAKLICQALEISREDFSQIIEYIKKYT